jgi:hypothetical protein
VEDVMKEKKQVRRRFDENFNDICFKQPSAASWRIDK